MMAFERLEPITTLQGDMQAGQICAVLANLKRDPKERPEPYTAADFMPSLRESQRTSAELEDGPSTRGDDLDDDAFVALFDAEMFGRAPAAQVPA